VLAGSRGHIELFRIMAALDAGVPLRDVQIAARHADPRTTTVYDRRRQNFDRHAA
jgi:integrase/recombinase XerD